MIDTQILGQEKNSQKVKLSNIEKISTLTFEHIRDAIDAAPPLQRSEIKKNFIGIKIEWEAYLNGANKDGDSVRLTLSTTKKPATNTIWCDVLLSEYKELGILPEGSKIRVQGEIEEAGTWDVRLKNVSLSY